MKEITFRPLRRIKKTGKITVASYMQWNKVRTADYNKFNLIIDDEYKRLPQQEFVYDHKGELLFWRDFEPGNIGVLKGDINFDYDKARKVYKEYIIEHGEYTSYFVSGLDCAGTPTFSHYSQERVARDFKDMSKFEPLTVEIVVKWFGWWLYQLNNSYLKIGK